MSTAKPREENGGAAASGSLSPLEQTVMGLAPPPSARATAAASTEPASIIVPASVIVPSSKGEPATASAAADPSPLESTLRIEPTALPVHAAAPEGAAPERAALGERTALTADYLREARAAALGDAAQPSPDPAALASTERATASEVAGASASALPLGSDTHRSVAPALEPRPEPAGVTIGSGPSGTRGFEPVPVVRAPLAESLSSSLGPLAELGGTRNLLPTPARPRPAPPRARESLGGRWLLLAAVALVTVAIVSVGGRLWQRYRAQTARQRALATVEASAATVAVPHVGEAPLASRALLANRPAPEPGDERVRVVAATAMPAAGEAGASTSPESQLAATAGRHVLSGNYAEALPLYRQLERSWPENTAYAAMARLLEKKVGSRNDTRTITPTPATPRP